MKAKLLPALLIVSCSLFVASCKKYVDEMEPLSTQASVGSGFVRSFVEYKTDGTPKTVGIEVSKGALSSLSRTEHGMYTLLLEDKIKHLTPFDHIVVDWNPKGHAPDSIYDVPHFDFHFYMISMGERMAIGDYEHDSVAINKSPNPKLLPSTYVPATADPAMGRHWVYKDAPELHNMPFTKTFVYGTYNARVNFLEPMIAKSFIDATTGFNDVILQPEIYSPIDRFFPMMYNGFRNEAGNFCVTLSNFQWRN